MTQRRAKVIRPTKLEVRPDLLEAFTALGVPASTFAEIVNREQAKGTTQAEFDQGLEGEAAKARAAKEANEEAQARAEDERRLAERDANRKAFAGMALQGILASPDDKFGNDFHGLVKLAVSYADALCDRLDKPAETEE